MDIKALWILLAISLSACNKQSDFENLSSRVSTLEAKINSPVVQESKPTDLEPELKALRETIHQIDTNQIWSEIRTAKTLDRHEEWIGKLHEYCDNLRATYQQQPKVVAVKSTSVDSDNLKEKSRAMGIPWDIFDQMKAAAVARYPSDFEMQALTLENNINAWKRLNP